jgi:hypothetical protein
MAKILGKNADFGIGTSDASADTGPFDSSDITRAEGASNEVSLNVETATIDTSAYGDDFDQFEVFTYNWNVDITVYLQDIGAGPPDTEALFVNGLLALQKRHFVLWPAGKPGGSEGSAAQPRYSGKVIIQSVGVPPNRSGVVPLRIRLQGDGQLFRSVA